MHERREILYRLWRATAGLYDPVASQEKPARIYLMSMKLLETSREFIFVYGTLRKATRSEMHKLLAKSSDFVAEAVFNGKLYDVVGGPAAIPSENTSDLVRGELYAIKPQQQTQLLTVLDEYEGYNPADLTHSEYRREKRTIMLPDCRSISAWIYLYNGQLENSRLILSGDFIRG